MANNNSAVSDKPTTAKKIPFAVSESYKTLRTNLLSVLKKGNKRVIVFSSPNAAEGKSTTAINTAISLSQLNQKVLLIDADIRRPSLPNKLKLSNNDGLINIVAGISEFDKTVTHYKPMLDILTTGPLLKNSLEIFSYPAFEDMLDSLRDRYDYIILDAPPINLLSDPLVIAQKCDGMVMVVRSGVTTHNTLKRAIASVEALEIDILGLVINGTNYATKRYY